MADLPDIVQRLIDSFNKLPGVGPKSAARMVFYLLYAPAKVSDDFAATVVAMKQKITFCPRCHNLSENKELCSICSDPERDQNSILVVEDVLDLFAFERIGDYKGVYHVLGGVISPVQGIGPEELTIASLLNRVAATKTPLELIIATNPNLEGEATGMYIKEKLAGNTQISISRIARGVPTGADLDYADRMTLKRALSGRTSL